MSREREPLSEGAILELAAGAAVVFGILWLIRNRDELARKAGNLVTDAATNVLQNTADAMGTRLVTVVQNIPGLQNYLQSISQPAQPNDVAIEIAPGVYEVNGQSYNANF